MRVLAVGGFAALAAVAMALSACGQNQAAASGPGPKATVIEKACRENILAKTPNPKLALVEDFRVVPYREFAAGLRRAVFERLSGEKLGRMQVIADQALTGGESATGGTWVIKLRATNLKGKQETVPAWCRSLRSAPDACTCESSLRTE